jgi:hypothetical protein
MLRIRPAAAAAALLAFTAGAARAQGGAVSPQCGTATAPERVAQDACQKSVDLFNFLAPQLGLSSRAATRSRGRVGPWGGSDTSGRAYARPPSAAPLPRFDRVAVTSNGARASAIPVRTTTVAFPVADLAIGLFAGVPVGITRVGGLDALLNATYVPDLDRGEVQVRTSGGRLRIGYGVRLGLLGETALVPGVSVSVLRRETPTTAITAVAGNDTLGVSGTRVRTDSWRLTAGKRFLFLGVAAGVGRDQYQADARVAGVVNDAVLGVPVRAESSVDLRQTVTRTNVFGNLTLLAIPFARVVGEVGRTSGGTLAPTYNSIDGRRPDAAYTYASLGVRLGR